MRTVEISQRTWDRLTVHARPLEDRAEDVISRALSALEREVQARATRPKETKPPKATTRDKLPQKFFRSPLLAALLECGGSAALQELKPLVEARVKEHLRNGDLEKVSTGDVRWWNAVCWERSYMVKDGLLKNDSPWGVWELSDVGWEEAKSAEHERKQIIRAFESSANSAAN